MTLAQPRKIIKDGARRGDVGERNGTPVFLVTGTDASLRLIADANHRKSFAEGSRRDWLTPSIP